MNPAKMLLPLLFALLIPLFAMADRPYTGKIIVNYEGTIEEIEYEGPLESHGSFFVISPSHAMTNWHVVQEYLEAAAEGQEDTKITLRFFNGETSTGEVVATEADPDLALIQFRGVLPKGVHRIPIASDFKVQRLTSGGYPWDGTKYEEETANQYEFLPGTPYFVFPGKFVQGQSGSPVINQDGKLCGILWGSDYPYKALGYGTRVTEIRKFLSEHAPEILELSGN
jgi:S1-C subfamily serine protease